MATLIALALLSGCSGATVDPRFTAANETRQARNQRLIDDFRNREAQSDTRLQWYTQLVERTRARHAENRAETNRRLAAMIQREREDRPQMVDQTLSDFAKEIAGHPERINGDIPGLFY